MTEEGKRREIGGKGRRRGLGKMREEEGRTGKKDEKREHENMNIK